MSKVQPTHVGVDINTSDKARLSLISYIRIQLPSLSISLLLIPHTDALTIWSPQNGDHETERAMQAPADGASNTGHRTGGDWRGGRGLRKQGPTPKADRTTTIKSKR